MLLRRLIVFLLISVIFASQLCSAQPLGEEVVVMCCIEFVCCFIPVFAVFRSFFVSDRFSLFSFLQPIFLPVQPFVLMCWSSPSSSIQTWLLSNLAFRFANKKFKVFSNSFRFFVLFAGAFWRRIHRHRSSDYRFQQFAARGSLSFSFLSFWLFCFLPCFVFVAFVSPSF